MNIHVSPDRLEQMAVLYQLPIEVDHTARRMVLVTPWQTYLAPLPEVQEVTC